MRSRHYRLHRLGRVLQLPHEEIGVRGSHVRADRCSSNLSVALSVESESVICEDHMDEITESGCLSRGI